MIVQQHVEKKELKNRVRECRKNGCLIELDIDVDICNRVRCPGNYSFL